MKTRVTVIKVEQIEEDGERRERFLKIMTPDGQLMYRRLYKLITESAVPDVPGRLIDDLITGINDAVKKTPEWLLDLAQRILLPMGEDGKVYATVFLNPNKSSSLFESLGVDWSIATKIADNNADNADNDDNNTDNNDNNTEKIDAAEGAEERVSMTQSLIELYLEFKKRLSLANNLLVCRYVRMLQFKIEEHVNW